MGRYKMIGRPLLPFRVLEGRVSGEEFEADLDELTESRLVGAGALAVLPEKRQAPKVEAKQEREQTRSEPARREPSR